MKMKDLKCNSCVYMVVKNKILPLFYMPHVFCHVIYLFINSGESDYFL